MIDLVHIWYDDRYSSKVLFSNIQAYYLKVKVMDLEIFNAYRISLPRKSVSRLTDWLEMILTVLTGPLNSNSN